MPSSSVSTETPRQRVPSLDHWVTQWMSTVTSSAGSAVNCCQSQRVVSPASVVTVNDQVAVFTGGVGAGLQHGEAVLEVLAGRQLDAAVAAAAAEAARIPRSRVELASASRAGTRPAGPGTGWSSRVVLRAGELRAGLVEVLARVGPEPGLARLEAADHRVAGRLGVRGGVLGRRVVAAADVPALGAAAQVQPPAARRLALDAAGAARRRRPGRRQRSAAVMSSPSSPSAPVGWAAGPGSGCRRGPTRRAGRRGAC